LLLLPLFEVGCWRIVGCPILDALAVFLRAASNALAETNYRPFKTSHLPGHGRRLAGGVRSTT